MEQPLGQPFELTCRRHNSKLQRVYLYLRKTSPISESSVLRQTAANVSRGAGLDERAELTLTTYFRHASTLAILVVGDIHATARYRL